MSKHLQNINLYLPEFRKKKYWLDAEKMVLLAGSALLLLVVASGIEYWQLERLRSARIQKEFQHEAITAATATLIAQYGEQTEDPVLLENIRTLEEGLQSKQALLQFMEGSELGNTAGFSEYLADLSRYHVQGLSLTHVSLTDGGRSVELAGQVLRAELVPMFLQNLSKGASYVGKDFEMLQIGNAESVDKGEDLAVNQMDVWDFQVRSLAR